MHLQRQKHSETLLFLADKKLNKLNKNQMNNRHTQNKMK